MGYNACVACLQAGDITNHFKMVLARVDGRVYEKSSSQPTIFVNFLNRIIIFCQSVVNPEQLLRDNERAESWNRFGAGTGAKNGLKLTVVAAIYSSDFRKYIVAQEIYSLILYRKIEYIMLADVMK